MSTSERMTVMDVPFWDYGMGKLRQTAGPVFRIDGEPDHSVIRDRISRAVEWCPTLRRRVVPSPGGLLRPRWVDDADFDLDYHLRSVRVEAPGDEASLWRLVSDLYRLPFDPTRPSWETYHITGLADGSSALMHRTLHFQVDGLSAMDLLRVLSDECDDLEGERARITGRNKRGSSAHRRGEASGEGRDWSLSSLTTPVRKVGEAIGHKTESIWPRTDLSWQRTLLGASLDLDVVRGIRRRTHTTVTSVFQTVVSLGVEAVLGDLPDELVISLPMSTRHLFAQLHPLELNSRQVSSPFVWPMHIHDPRERLNAIDASLGDLKLERESFVRTVRAARFAPHKLIYLATRRKILASNLIASAAAGPKKRRHIDGHTVRGLHLFTAIVPHNPIAIVGASYGDRFDIGVTSDPTLMPRILDLPKALQAGLDQLDAATR